MADGGTRSIVDIVVETKATKVYNIEVSGNHNYCVGLTRMLVHNKGGGGGGDGKPPPTHTEYTHGYDRFEVYMHMLCGVPVWYDDEVEDEEIGTNIVEDDYGKHRLHFGLRDFYKLTEDPDSYKSLYSAKYTNNFDRNYNFFTHDITKDGMGTFDFPFASTIDQWRGVLSNWWAGCEPVCGTLEKLLKDGFFFA